MRDTPPSAPITLLLFPLLLLAQQMAAQELAAEFFGTAPGLILPTPAPKAPPSEEELIGKLLRSGAGLPPGAAVPPGPPGTDAGAGGGATAGGTAGKGSPPNPRPPPPSPKFAAPPSSPPNYIQCLLQIAPKICDPDGVLNAEQRQEIDQTLAELLSATRKESGKDECTKSGLETMFIIVKHHALLDDPMMSVQQKLNTALDNWVRDHPCEKPVVIMLSTDPSMYNRKVWTGRHFEVPVDPRQLVQLFMAQESLTRQEKYAEVILNIIEGILDRYENAIGK